MPPSTPTKVSPDVFFDVTRAYVARHEEAMRAAHGDAWLSELRATIDAAEAEADAWHRSEPRLWNRLLMGIVTGFGVRTWRARLRLRRGCSISRSMRYCAKAG